ncbi:hypothetical protein LUZ60_011510 [Juncus effusus]|nr:hypothetical protein LUZ60_011510 [Juncus effusus]
MVLAPLCFSPPLLSLPSPLLSQRIGDEADGTMPGLYKWRLVIAYDGTNFKGWQYQPAGIPTVQWHIEDALLRITRQDRKQLALVGSSRTDTGVHASAQVAHFTTTFNYDSLHGLHSAMNGLLPKDIQIREISAARPEFHARFSTKSKVYRYKIYNEPVMDPFHRLYAYHSTYRLNPQAMREAAAFFVGKHDFLSFGNVPSRNDGTPCTVKDIFRFDINESDAILELEVEGSGFLYRQVRNMVALLIQVGKEALPPDIVPKILAARDRKALAKFTFQTPPHGLCLMSVKYDPETLKPPPFSPSVSFGRTHSVCRCKLPFY